MAAHAYPDKPTICCLGAGYVGGPTMSVIAKMCPDIKVTVCDLNERRIAAWNSANLPIYEPGLQEVVEEARGRNLFFSTDTATAIRESTIIFVSVNTPTKKSGIGAGEAADLTYWELAARNIASVCLASADKAPKIIVEKSTVPVKTADAMAAVMHASCSGTDFQVLSNPEFLAEGTAINDLFKPDRVLVGGPQTAQGLAAVECLANVYRRWVDTVLTTNLWSAELSKLAVNAFLAQRVSSINSISALCEKTGADVDEVAHSVGIDSRIGPKMLQASVGFGGTCYETHLRNLVYMCRTYRLKEAAVYWESVLKMNEWQKRRFANKIVSSMFNTVSGKKLAVLGFAYKKNTSDTRGSPAIDVCRALLAESARLSVYDPRVKAEAIGLAFTDDEGADRLLTTEDSAYAAAAGAHAIILLTEWDEFTSLDYGRIFGAMQKPAFVFDGRNCLDHEALREVGFTVFGIGKPQPSVEETEEVAARREADELAASNRVRVGSLRLDADSPIPSPLTSPGAAGSPPRSSSPPKPFGAVPCE